jgi:sugar lactone lactonase YvrE
MSTTRIHVIAALAASTLLAAGSAYAADVQTTAIAGVVNAGTKVEFIKEGFEGTEGPIGLPDGSALFTETRANRITRIAPDNSVSSYLENSNGSNGLAFDNDGKLVSVQNQKPRVGIVYPAGQEKTLAEQFESKPFQRPNDLVLDKRGGVYFTDIGVIPKEANGEPARPAVYYIKPDGALTRVANDIERPNGVQLSPDEKTLYVANTAGEYIVAYDLAADGSASNRRNFAKLAGYQKNDQGAFSSGADGLAVDAEVRLYVASKAGIEVFDAKGRTLGVIPVPHKPQNLAFAGKDKKTLYIVGRGAAYKVALLTPGYGGRAK